MSSDEEASCSSSTRNKMNTSEMSYEYDEEASTSSSSDDMDEDISYELKSMKKKKEPISPKERKIPKERKSTKERKSPKVRKSKKELLSKSERKALKLKLLEEEDKVRRENATKAMNYLLQHSQKYSDLFLDTLQNNTNEKSLLKCKPQNGNKKIKNNEIKRKEKKKTEISSLSQPKYFVGTLYPYQHEGVSWLKLLYENSVNGILADEMGLGKTIQVIALICALIEKQVEGPFLIVAPLSTIPNWVSEFKKFAPKIPVVLFHGTAEQREKIYPKLSETYTVDKFETRPVVITSYQVPLLEGQVLNKHRWQYLIIDEGQRIKNLNSKLFFEMKRLKSSNRLLLTGTPLQNDLTELWTLLNFLMPQFFKKMDTFGDLFQVEDFNETDKILKQEKDTNIISTIHGVLSPFMLRRLKVEVLDMVPKKEVLVYCPLSELQSNLYRYVLQKNIKELLGVEEEEKENSGPEKKKRKCVKTTSYLLKGEDDDISEESSDAYLDLPINVPDADKKAIHRHIFLMNPMMLMRKIINHPFTVHCPIVPGTREIIISEDIVTQSGKMMVLDAMLNKLKKRGHRVLIFSQFTSVLDFIEDYLGIRKYEYCRLDGSRNITERQQNIHEFNTNPEKFVFLISTRAGGLGLNLTQADTVILYDRDWNPQCDLQAQDRCHRIGQKKPVVVYSLISKGTIDDYILERATAKRRLEKIVIQKGKFKSISSTDNIIKSVNDLKELEVLLNSVDHEQVIQPNGFVLSDEELDKILDRSDLMSEK